MAGIIFLCLIVAMLAVFLITGKPVFHFSNAWDAQLDSLSRKLERELFVVADFIHQIWRSVKWSWDSMTMICICLIILFTFFVGAFLYPVIRRKLKQRRWRAKLRKENEERISRR